MKEPRTMKRLPRSVDDIRGLRVARWIRESTAGQYDRYGPASQREQQDRFIERHGLVDTGLVFQVAHSGTTVWRSATMTEMLTERGPGRSTSSGRLLGPWQRNLRRTLELLEDGIHPGRRPRHVRPADPSSEQDWDELISGAAGAEKYSPATVGAHHRRVRRQVRSPRRPSGTRALGFRRLPSRPTPRESTRTDAVAVGLFERYGWATQRERTSTTRPAAESGSGDHDNTIYNGWFRRHRRSD